MRVRGPGFPLNYTDKGPAREGLSDEEPGYNIVVDGAFCAVTIEEGPPPEGGWPPLPPAIPRGVRCRHNDEPPAAEASPATPPEDPAGA